MRISTLLLSLVLALAAAAAAAGQPSTATRPASKADAQPSTATQPSTTAAAEPAKDGGGTIRGKNLWQTLSRGGPLMVPILLCSLVGVAFAVERVMSLRQGAVAPKALAKQALEKVQAGKPREALELCRQRPSSLGRVLVAGLELADRPRQEMVAAMEETGERELWNLDRFAKPLSIIAGVSPLLGLLGTVWGMILAFDVVAQKGALGDPKALAGGIATALLTTLAGLTVAIPCYILYHYFRSRSDRLIIEIEETASHIAAAVHGSPTRADPPTARGERGAAPDAVD